MIIGILQHIANAREKNVISPLFLEKEPYNISKMEKEPSILNIENGKRSPHRILPALCIMQCIMLQVAKP